MMLSKDALMETKETKETKEAKEIKETKTKYKHMRKKRDYEIAKLRAHGFSLREISNELKKKGETICKSTISNICEKEDVKALIENEQRKLVELVPTAVKNYRKWIDAGQITNSKEEREISYKATTKVLESTGILNGAPSTLVNILYQENQTIISPIIKNLLSEFTNKLNNFDDVIDVEVE